MSDVVFAYELDADGARFAQIGVRLERVLLELQTRYGWSRENCEQFALDCIAGGVTNAFHIADLARACERGPGAYFELLERVA